MSEFSHWIDVRANVKHVRFSRVAELMALALHPVPDGNEVQAVACAGALINLEAELPAAVRAGEFEVLDPLTFGRHPLPVGQALADSLVSIDELKRFVGKRGIGVRLIPHFVTSARPLEVPTALLTLPGDAQVSYEHNIGRQQGSGITNAADYRNSIQDTIARQAEGFFTVNEAAQVLADSRPGMRAVEWVKEIQQAHRAGVLPIRDTGSRLRMRPLRANDPKEIPKEWTAAQDMERDCSDLLLLAELDAWLRDSLGYGFPRAEGDNLSAPAIGASATLEPTPDRDGRVKRWTPEALESLKQYRAVHGTKAAAAKFAISQQRIRELLPKEKTAPPGFSAFNQQR